MQRIKFLKKNAEPLARGIKEEKNDKNTPLTP